MLAVSGDQRAHFVGHHTRFVVYRTHFMCMRDDLRKCAVEERGDVSYAPPPPTLHFDEFFRTSKVIPHEFQESAPPPNKRWVYSGEGV